MFTDKLKGLVSKYNSQDGNNKKKIENLVFFVVILIITIIIINIILNGNEKETHKDSINTTSKQLATVDGENINNNDNNSSIKGNLEEKLENILSKIQGVGEVDVFVNYSESSEVIAMYNETSKVSNTEETDTSGGVRKVQETDTQKDIIYKEDDGEKTPITKKVIEPKVEGAIITAQGATDVVVKTNIIQAVEAVTGLATHKIQVFEMQ